jgi:hypothetical protein
MKTNLTLGAQIYYTGDMANSSGNFEVVGLGGNNITLREMDGDRVFHVYASQIGDVYQGHCNPRFVTEEARQTYRKARGL